MRKRKAVKVAGLGLLLVSSLAQVPSAVAAATADVLEAFHSPARYFTYFAQEHADAPWISSSSHGCQVGFNRTFHAVKIVAMSGAEVVIPCPEQDSKAAFTEAGSRLEAAEIERAIQSRAGFDRDSVLFDPYTLIMALLKHDAAAYDDQAWITMTKAEIKQAQFAFSQDTSSTVHDWVFTAHELQGRNPDIAGEELMPRFKQEVLRRAQANPDRFLLTMPRGNLKYNRATGTLSFGRVDAQGRIIVKSPLNFKYQGQTVYGVDKGDGVKAYSNELAKTAGLRAPAAQGGPGLIFDRDLIIPELKLSQENAERLLNSTQMLTVNVVLSVVGATRADGAKGLAMRSTNGFLHARIEGVAVTDPAGRVLTTYDVAALPASSAAPAAIGDRPDIPQKARIFCGSFEKRVAQAKQQRNERLVGYLEEQARIHACDKW